MVLSLFGFFRRVLFSQCAREGVFSSDFVLGCASPGSTLTPAQCAGHRSTRAVRSSIASPSPSVSFRSFVILGCSETHPRIGARVDAEEIRRRWP